jgi:hypothetical protein
MHLTKSSAWIRRLRCGCHPRAFDKVDVLYFSKLDKVELVLNCIAWMFDISKAGGTPRLDKVLADCFDGVDPPGLCPGKAEDFVKCGRPDGGCLGKVEKNSI